MKASDIRSVGIIGAGTMGQGIAQVCASAGFQVLLYDVQSDFIPIAINAIRKNLRTLAEKQKITLADVDATTARITAANDLRELRAELIIEAVVEKLEVKRKLFNDLEFINSEESTFVSNTSSIPITQIGSGLKHPGRFAGLHFFNPAPQMKLVEVIKGSSTDNATIELLFTFCKRIAKQAVLVQDSPGFIVNRVARHFYVESLKVLEDNVTDHEGVDKLMRSAGFRMGPFELMDLIGIDVNFSVTSSLFNSFYQDPKFRPNRIQQQKVDAGHLGRKSGRGFYDYKR